MDLGEEYRNTRDRVLPAVFKEHFEKTRENLEVIRNTLKKITTEKPSSKEVAVLTEFTQVLSNNIFSYLDIFNDNIEALFIYQSLNNERFRDIHNVLEKHGIKIDNISNDEGLEWLNNYFKRAGKTTID